MKLNIFLLLICIALSSFTLANNAWAEPELSTPEGSSYFYMDEDELLEEVVRVEGELEASTQALPVVESNLQNAEASKTQAQVSLNKSKRTKSKAQKKLANLNDNLESLHSKAKHNQSVAEREIIKGKNSVKNHNAFINNLKSAMSLIIISLCFLSIIFILFSPGFKKVSEYRLKMAGGFLAVATLILIIGHIVDTPAKPFKATTEQINKAKRINLKKPEIKLASKKFKLQKNKLRKINIQVKQKAYTFQVKQNELSQAEQQARKVKKEIQDSEFKLKALNKELKDF